jgi:hypothetical protein
MSKLNLCAYKNIFGEPNKGIHKYRVFDIEIVDVLMTIIGAYIIYIKIKKPYPNIKFYQILISLFILGIILHRLFCVRTKIDRLLFN